MHEGSMIKNILATVDQVRREQANKPVKRITVEISEFGSLDEEHFRYHFDEEAARSVYKNVELEVKKVPFGQDVKLVSVTFGQVERELI